MEPQIQVTHTGGKKVYRGTTQMQDSRLELLAQYQEVQDNGRTLMQNKFEEMRPPRKEKNILLDPKYDEDVNVEKERTYMYVGDDFGILKLWDMTYLLETAGYPKCRPHKETRGKNYYPNRKENVNVKAHYPRHMQVATMMKTKQPAEADPEDAGLIIREIVAH